MIQLATATENFSIKDSLKEFWAEISSSEILSDSQVTGYFTANTKLMHHNNAYFDFMRFVGFSLIRGLRQLADASQKLFNTAFGLIGFTTDSEGARLISQFKPLFLALFILSLVVLGLTLIITKDKKKPKILQGVIMAVAVVTCMSTLTGVLSEAVTYGKEAILGTEEEREVKSSATFMASNYIFDLAYLDSTIGLINLSFDEKEAGDTGEAKGSFSNDMYHEDLDDTEFFYIDINETLSPEDDKLTTPEGKELMKYDVVRLPGGEWQVVPVSNGIKVMGNLGNNYYYRYKVSWFPLILVLVSLVMVYLVMSYKIVRIIFEIVVHRILAYLYSANINGLQKTKKIVEGFINSYIVIFLCCILIKLYLLFTQYISTASAMNPFGKSLILLFAAMAIVDGPNIIQQVTGIDAGLSHAIGTFLALGRTAAGAGRAAGTVRDRVERHAASAGARPKGGGGKGKASVSGTGKPAGAGAGAGKMESDTKNAASSSGTGKEAAAGNVSSDKEERRGADIRSGEVSSSRMEAETRSESVSNGPDMNPSVDSEKGINDKKDGPSVSVDKQAENTKGLYEGEKSGNVPGSASSARADALKMEAASTGPVRQGMKGNVSSGTGTSYAGSMSGFEKRPVSSESGRPVSSVMPENKGVLAPDTGRDTVRRSLRRRPAKGEK